MKLLLLDNYDSFTYNLYHLLEQFDVELTVLRNDEVTVNEAGNFDRIVISPGPGIPEEAGITKEIIRAYQNVKPMLGVCLGMQAMAEVAGGRLVNLPQVMHGFATEATVVERDEELFHGLPEKFSVGHYHSWCVDSQTLPSEYTITCCDSGGLPMAMTHKNKLLRGVQFHPESILTEYGKELISNWLFRCG